MLKRLLQALSINRSGIILIISGSLMWSLTMVKSGWIYSYGMGFWGPNGHDGVWHIALAKSLTDGTWEIPVFSGEIIKNYHVGFDLILSIIHKLTRIPSHVIYFQLMPPSLALLIGIFVYKFVNIWKKSSLAAFWATFFVYFGGSWGWVVTLLKEDQLGGESIFWSQQSISTLVNPPFALSLVFLLIGMWVLVSGAREKNKELLTIATFLFGVLVQIKVYAGLLILMGLLMAGLWRLVNRKGAEVLKVFLGALVMSVLIFSPLSWKAEDALIFRPFWFLESMMATPDRFYWPRFAEALENYKLAGNWLKGSIAYGIAFAIFWFGNLGTRIFKEPLFVRHAKDVKKAGYIEILLYTTIVLGVLIPTLFLQRGTPWNTIQFFYYALFFSGILAGVYLAEFIQKSKLGNMLVWVIVSVVILLTIPTTVGTLWHHYLPSRPPAKISKNELEALNFLNDQPDGVVLTLPFDKDLAAEAVNKPPRPLYLYESTAYVSAFSGKKVYLEDEVNLEITGYPWRARREDSERYFDVNNREFLLKNNISYLYLVKFLGKDTKVSGNFARIFTNEEVDIYKVSSALE